MRYKLWGAEGTLQVSQCGKWVVATGLAICLILILFLLLLMLLTLALLGCCFGCSLLAF